MTYKVDDGYTVRDLIQASLDSLTASRLLFHQGAWAYDSAGYLAHLGVEHLAKSLLLNEIGYFSEGHSLHVLKKALALVLPEVASALDDKKIAQLDRFFKLRYPQPQAPVAVGISHWNVIHEMVQRVVVVAPKSWHHEWHAIDPTKKGGRVFMTKSRSSLDELPGGSSSE